MSRKYDHEADLCGCNECMGIESLDVGGAMSGRQLLAIDIPGVVVQPEPAGRGWQVHAEGDTCQWSRGDTQDEAVGSLVRRLALEHEGANWRREALPADPGASPAQPIAEPCPVADRPPAWPSGAKSRIRAPWWGVDLGCNVALTAILVAGLIILAVTCHEPAPAGAPTFPPDGSSGPEMAVELVVVPGLTAPRLRGYDSRSCAAELPARPAPEMVAGAFGRCVEAMGGWEGEENAVNKKEDRR